MKTQINREQLTDYLRNEVAIMEGSEKSLKKDIFYNMETREFSCSSLYTGSVVYANLKNEVVVITLTGWENDTNNSLEDAVEGFLSVVEFLGVDFDIELI